MPEGQEKIGENVFDHDLGVWVDGPMGAIEVALSALNEYSEDEPRIAEVYVLLQYLGTIYDPDSSTLMKDEAYAEYRRDCRVFGHEEEEE